MHRFFVPPAVLQSQPVILTGELAHQIRRVLRVRLGERVELLDGHGWSHESIVIAYGDGDAKLQTVKRRPAEGEASTQITLCQAVLKGNHFAWAIQKATEIGVARFVPIICERNVVDDLEAVEEKHDRWQRIIQEAAEQSGRARIPVLQPACLFAQAVQPDHVAAPEPGAAIRLIAWEEERTSGLRDTLLACNFKRGDGIQLLVGPEGGFSPAEVRLASGYGIRPVSLGRRILRSETAGVVASAIILYEAGEL